MKKTVPHKLDVYTELCPASSAAIIGAGLVTATMGEFSAGAAVAITGIAIGVAAPVAKSIIEHGHVRKH